MKSYDLVGTFLRLLVYPVLSFVSGILGKVFIVTLAFLVYCVMKYQLNPFRLTKAKLLNMRIRLKPANFIRWALIDMMDAPDHRDEFQEFGLTLYCGRQGAGKTISMVEYLNRAHYRYPKALIVTNFDYIHATRRMESWQDFMDIRNGEDGVIFAIDEIHSEYSSASSKNFPESLLSEISQQRKQRVKIVATAQVFNRVAKPLREQCFSVNLCSTFFKRWTFTREYHAQAYEMYCESTNRDKKLKTLGKHSFVQSDYLRNCYDTYSKIERMRTTDFIPRNERQ